jgi:polyisoprenoid-binding protein YceI
MATATRVFEGVFEADVDHSSFEAGTRHMGVGSFRTRFEDVSARLTGDASGVRLEGRAQVISISIRNPPEFREHVVNGEDFFDAARHPEIRFSSSDISLHDDGTLALVGELTIKDVTRRITATGSYRPPTEDPYGGVRTAVDLTTTIDRRDFGLSWQAELPKGGNVLEWDVVIDVHLELVKA